MNPKKHYRKILLNFLISILIIGALLGILALFNLNLGKTSAKINSLSNNLFSRSSSIQGTSELKSQYNAYGESYLNVLYNVVPQKDELINFPKEIQTLASAFDLSLGFSYVGESAVTDEAPGSVSFQISVEGPEMASIIEFIKEFENFRYFTQLESFAVGPSNANIKANIRGKVFFRN